MMIQKIFRFLINIFYDLNDYTINNLTCEKIAENFIKLVNNLNNENSPKNVLMLTDGGGNYSMVTLAYGLRKNLQNNFVDFPKINSLYEKKDFNIYLEEGDIDINRENILDKIKKKFYDYIIFGPIGPDENCRGFLNNYEELVLSKYKKTEIIYVFGGDRPFNIKWPNKYKNYLRNYLRKGICFVRELDDNTTYYNVSTWNNYAKKCEVEYNKKINLAYSIKDNISNLI